MNTPRTMPNKLSRKRAVLVGRYRLCFPWVCSFREPWHNLPRDADVRADAQGDRTGKSSRFTTASAGRGRWSGAR